MTDIVAEYLEHEEKSKDLTMKMREYFSKLPMDEKIEWAVNHSTAFLIDEGYFCPRLLRGSGDLISLYDDLYWERHETNDIEGLLELAQEDWEGWDNSLTEEDNLKMFTEDLKTMDTPVAVVLRHMLENNIGQATYDW